MEGDVDAYATRSRAFDVLNADGEPHNWSEGVPEELRNAIEALEFGMLKHYGLKGYQHGLAKDLSVRSVQYKGSNRVLFFCSDGRVYIVADKGHPRAEGKKRRGKGGDYDLKNRLRDFMKRQA